MVFRATGSVFVFLSLLAGSPTFAAAVGRIDAQFGVSQIGAAKYTIPIRLPPGTNGLQPSLALDYDSRISGGSMGPGWALAGFSSIMRCSLTTAQDGTPAAVSLATTDGYCLDGKRLRTTGGTYQTEIADFSLITPVGQAGNGPQYFIVKGKNGLTYEYGYTADSQMLFNASSTTPYGWLLDKVTDRSGNQMTFTYWGPGQPSNDYSYVPLTINYTAPLGSTTFPYTVSFNYPTQNLSATDAKTKDLAGGQITQPHQLQTISVKLSGNTLWVYTLDYETGAATGRQRLNAVAEGGLNADYFPPTLITYQNGTAGIVAPATATGITNSNGTIFSADIDGDGHQDLIYAVTSGSNYLWYVQFTGSSTPVNTGITTVGSANLLIDNFNGKLGNAFLAPSGSTWYLYTWNGTSFTATSTGIAVVASAIYASVDIDGDGLPDLPGDFRTS